MSSSTLSSRLVTLHTLGHSECRGLLSRIHAVQREVFHEVGSVDMFSDFVLGAGASELYAWLLERRDDGQLVGYNVIRYHECDVAGRRAGVYYADVGLLPGYRGQNRTLAAGLRLAIPRLLRNPGQPLFFHSFLQHPSIYVVIEKHARTFWPKQGAPVPPHVAELVRTLNRQSRVAPWSPGDDWIVRLPTFINETAEQRAALHASTRPAVRYYLERNPHYAEGASLVLLIPLTLGNLLSGVKRTLQYRLARPAAEPS